MVTSLLIQNSSSYPILFVGIGYKIQIPGNAIDFECQIPAANAEKDIQILIGNAPNISVEIVGSGEGVPGPIYTGDYTPIQLGDENYQGVWDASEGSAPDEIPEPGWYWRVSTSGTTELGGIGDWSKDDFIRWTGTMWMKVIGVAGYREEFERIVFNSGLKQQVKGELIVTTGVTDFPEATAMDILRISDDSDSGWIGGDEDTGLWVSKGDLLLCNKTTISGSYLEVGQNWNLLRSTLSELFAVDVNLDVKPRILQ